MPGLWARLAAAVAGSAGDDENDQDVDWDLHQLQQAADSIDVTDDASDVDPSLGEDEIAAHVEDAEERNFDIPDDLKCGICHGLLDGAMQTPCCGGLSCRECIEAVAASATAQCPYCRQSGLEAHGLQRDVRIERAAACFVRPCDYAGCGYRGKRDELKVHAVNCNKRPKDEVIAELRNAAEHWRKQRCWQLFSIRKQAGESGWTAAIQNQLAPLQCRVHILDGLAAPGQPQQPRVHEAGSFHWSLDYSPEMQPLPRTRFELVSAPESTTYIKVSHIKDQPEPTTCFVIRGGWPVAARCITIPAKAGKAAVVKDLLTEEQARGVVNVFLARTLGDFGLTEARTYALEP